ncbi:MAG: T9SS C-terminal target domain-containing protein [Ignavibacteriae bacterium]|nr:MAG: T9SS C-terminal target domain-containing protein [Ignavibacteriota bacterium]
MVIEERMMKHGMATMVFLTGVILALIPSILSSQQDTIRVACVGNSITEGNAMSTKLLDAYPVALGRYLGAGYNVKNFGVSGRTLTKRGDYPIWNEPLFAQALGFNPNIVTILLGTNDSKPYNWIHKDEFMRDYYAMIDTFRQRPIHPEIYICLPLPSFTDAYDIRDSVIKADIIPMIRRIADSAKVKLIDLNTPFLDKRDLMPDGIHPLIAGSDLLARLLYKDLVGKGVDSLKENNVALKKPVVQGSTLLPEITDGNTATQISFTSTSTPVIVSLGTAADVDLIQIHFTKSKRTNLSFTLALSQDSVAWSTVSDTTIVDTLLLSEKNILKYIASFSPRAVRFVKFQMNPGGVQDTAAVLINEIKVLERRAVHAPVLGWKFVSQTPQTLRIKFIPQRNTNINGIMKIHLQASATTSFTILYNYGAAIPADIFRNINFGALIKFYCTIYENGAEATSDTLTITGERMTDVIDAGIASPALWALSQNYPNPFNPSTTIEYALPRDGFVSLKVYDVLGREVAKLVDEIQQSGTHKVTFNNLDNSQNAPMRTGVYFYTITANGFTQTRKMVLVK